MSQSAAFVYNTALIILEDCMLLLLAMGLFSKKRSGLVVGLSFFALAVLSCILLFFFASAGFLKIVLSGVLFSTWLILCYEASWQKAIFAVLFWLAYLTVGDNGFLALTSAITGRSQFDLMSDPNSYYLLCFSSKTTEILGIVILRTWLKSHFTNVRITLSDWLRVIIFPSAMLAVSAFLLRIYCYAPEMAAELTVCNAIVLLVDYVSVFLMNYLERQQELSRDNIILRQSMKAQLDNVEAWRKAYDGQRKQTHDFQNQLLVIHGLVQQRAPVEEILGYIERLQVIDPPGAMLVKTHRTAVDIILNQKYSIAESCNIRFITHLDDLSGFPLPDDALVTVLSNLIDNAIDACEKMDMDQDRWISLKMRVESSASFLYIENTTASPVTIKDNHIVTTKSNKLEHGYGIQNIFAVLDQYKSIYLLEYHPSEKTFSFSAQIPLQQQSQ